VEWWVSRESVMREGGRKPRRLSLSPERTLRFDKLRIWVRCFLVITCLPLWSVEAPSVTLVFLINRHTGFFYKQSHWF
jgi:hypothetical protein